MKLIAALLASALLVAAAAYGAKKALAPEAEVLATLAIEEVEFSRSVEAEGNLRAVKATPITAPQAQRPYTISWVAPDGSSVAKDEVVVRFAARELEKALLDGKDDRAIAKTSMATDAAESKKAQRSRDRSAELARAELEQTREFQSKDQEIFSRHQIIESQIDSALSESRLDHANRSKEIERRVSRTKVALHSVKTREAQMRIDRAEKQLRSLEVRTPHAGILVLKRDWRGNEIRIGETVWMGQRLAEIPITDEMEAEVFVLEADGGGLEEGLEAIVTIESAPDHPIKATIQKVEKLAKRRVRGSPVQYFSVTLELAETRKDVMKPGQRVRSTITIANDKALVVPRQAVFSGDGGSFVYRTSGPFSWPVPVELGAASPGRVAIEGGVRAGDQIALQDPLSRDEEPAADEAKKPPKLGGAK